MLFVRRDLRRLYEGRRLRSYDDGRGDKLTIELTKRKCMHSFKDRLSSFIELHLPRCPDIQPAFLTTIVQLFEALNLFRSHKDLVVSTCHRRLCSQ